MSNRLIVSRSALAANYRLLQANAQGEVAAVVKADGYGLGATAVSHCLAEAGCREFFVATAAEGSALRNDLVAAHPDAVIYVLEGVWTETVEALRSHNLVPVLNTAQQCAAWVTTGLPAALHVDTGMQRLGMAPAEALQFVSDPTIPITLLISHFARADEPEDESIAAQMSLIQPLYQALREAQPDARLSLSNSAALLSGVGPEHLGRAGIGLYGGNPFAERENPMSQVACLEARVLQVRDIESGVAVGYGGSFVSEKPMRLATVAAGYADGVPRLLSDRGRVFVAGQYCSIVGRVSMDMIHVDVTDVEVQEGDWAEVLGQHVTVDEVAELAQTLAYEILTGLGPRVTREFRATLP